MAGDSQSGFMVVLRREDFEIYASDYMVRHLRLVQLGIPFTLAFEKEVVIKGQRKSRNVIATSFDDNIYFDAIGIPRGVPDEFKARTQIAAGFESVLFW